MGACEFAKPSATFSKHERQERLLGMIGEVLTSCGIGGDRIA